MDLRQTPISVVEDTSGCYGGEVHGVGARPDAIFLYLIPAGTVPPAVSGVSRLTEAEPFSAVHLTTPTDGSVPVGGWIRRMKPAAGTRGALIRFGSYSFSFSVGRSEICCGSVSHTWLGTVAPDNR